MPSAASPCQGMSRNVEWACVWAYVHGHEHTKVYGCRAYTDMGVHILDWHDSQRAYTDMAVRILDWHDSQAY